MRSKRLLVVLVLGVAGVIVFAAGSAIGSSKRQVGPPVTYNSSGEPFIRSPNGQYSITVGNAGIVLSGAGGGRIVLSGTNLIAFVPNLILHVQGNASITTNAGSLGFRSATSLSLMAGTNVSLNGCAQPVVRGTDSVTVSGSTGRIVPGQAAVCMG